MPIADIIYGAVVLIVCVSFVVLCIGLGWYCVWKLFLCRFKFVEELLDWDEEKSKKSHRYEKDFQRELRKRESYQQSQKIK